MSDEVPSKDLTITDDNNPMHYNGDDSEMTRLLAAKNSLDVTKPAGELLAAEVPLAIQVFHNDLTHSDYKARQSAASQLLDRAGISQKKDDRPAVQINLNFESVAAGLRQVAEIGLGRSKGE